MKRIQGVKAVRVLVVALMLGFSVVAVPLLARAGGNSCSASGPQGGSCSSGGGSGGGRSCSAGRGQSCSTSSNGTQPQQSQPRATAEPNDECKEIPPAPTFRPKPTPTPAAGVGKGTAGSSSGTSCGG